MKSTKTWTPSKYILKNGVLRASKNTSELGIASRLAGAITAEHYQKNIKKYAKGALLDLGCGKSPFYEIYSKYTTSSTSADWKNTNHKNKNIDIECDLTQKLPFASETFDTIILSDVLEHIPNPNDLLGEIHRISKSNGILLLNTPFLYCIHEDPYDYYRYTRYSLQHLIEKSGLTLIDLIPTGGSPEVFTDFLSKHIQYTPLIGPALASGIQNIALAIRKTEFGKKISNRTAERFPFGYFVIAQK